MKRSCHRTDLHQQKNSRKANFPKFRNFPYTISALVRIVKNERKVWFFTRAIIRLYKTVPEIDSLSNSIADVITEQRKCVCKGRHSKRFWCVCAPIKISHLCCCWSSHPHQCGRSGTHVASTHTTFFSNKTVRRQLDVLHATMCGVRVAWRVFSG